MGGGSEKKSKKSSKKEEKKRKREESSVIVESAVAAPVADLSFLLGSNKTENDNDIASLFDSEKVKKKKK